jgi:cation:H+ antiporter
MVVTNAVAVARLLGVSELLIGMSIVAVGTSLPEIVTSVTAARKKTPELVIGNALGSNVINIFVVLGLTALIAPVRAEREVWRFDLPILLVSTIAVIALMRTGKLSRVWGAILVAGYLAYVAASFILRTTQ